MDDIRTEIPIFNVDDRHLINRIIHALQVSEISDTETSVQTIHNTIHRLEQLASLMISYPSLLESQTLGRQTRDTSSLVEALSHATLFTVDLILPMRAVVGQTYLMARLHFFRMLYRVVHEAFTEPQEAIHTEALLTQRISQCIHAKVIESLLIAIVGDNTLDQKTRIKGAEELTYLWEDRFSMRVEAFYPVLEATWEARRKITVRLGTLMGISEMFELMGEGGDPRFIDYFARLSCTQEESEAFQEFLFGLTREHLESLNTMLKDGERTVIDKSDAPVLLDSSHLDGHSITDYVTQLYMFFGKRHQEALTRRVSNLPGPKRTAEEYVMIFFLENDL